MEKNKGIEDLIKEVNTYKYICDVTQKNISSVALLIKTARETGTEQDINRLNNLYDTYNIMLAKYLDKHKAAVINSNIALFEVHKKLGSDIFIERSGSYIKIDSITYMNDEKQPGYLIKYMDSEGNEQTDKLITDSIIHFRIM